MPDVAGLQGVIQSYANEGKSDSIYAVYCIPSAMVTNTNLDAHYSGQSLPNTITKTFVKPTSLNGYTPKNKKLLTAPYCFINISNNNGSINTLYYENFHDPQNENQIYFMIKGVPTVGGSIKCIPMHYKNSNIENEDEGLMAGKFPTLSWSEDMFTNWLTQNGVNLSLGVLSSLITMAGGVRTNVNWSWCNRWC